MRGIGDVNRKSIGGTVAGFVGVARRSACGSSSATACRRPGSALAVVIALSNTLLELFSPRGTDDFIMATGNAVMCLAFGLLVQG